MAETSLLSEDEKEISAFLSGDEVQNSSLMISVEQGKSDRSERMLFLRSAGIRKEFERDTPQGLDRTLQRQSKKISPPRIPYKIPTPKELFSYNRREGFEPYIGQIYHRAHTSPKKKKKRNSSQDKSSPQKQQNTTRPRSAYLPTGPPPRADYSDSSLVQVAFSPYLQSVRQTNSLEQKLGDMIRSIKDPSAATKGCSDFPDALHALNIEEAEVINSIKTLKTLAESRRKAGNKNEEMPECLLTGDIKQFCSKRVKPVRAGREWENEKERRRHLYENGKIQIVLPHKSNVRPASAPQREIVRRLSSHKTVSAASPVQKRSPQLETTAPHLDDDGDNRNNRNPLLSLGELMYLNDDKDDDTISLECMRPESMSLLSCATRDLAIPESVEHEESNHIKFVAISKYDRKIIDQLCDFLIQETNLVNGTQEAPLERPPSRNTLSLTDRLITSGPLRQKENPPSGNPFPQTGRGGVMYRTVPRVIEKTSRKVVELHSPVKYWS